MRTIADTNARWAGDDGAPDAEVRRALAAAGNRDGYLRAVVALGGARLLVPVVTAGDDGGDGPDPDRHAELSAVTLENTAGERALLAFTGLDSLQSWRRDARPVPGTLDEVAASAGELGATVVLIDVAGPHPLELTAELVAELAQGRRLVALDDGGFGWAFRA